MDKLIAFKITLVVGCITLALVAFANKNQTATWQSVATNLATVNSNPLHHKTVPVSDTILTNAAHSVLGGVMSKVTMRVSNGTIYLSGQLDSDADYEKVVTLAASTPGVNAVNVDKLMVTNNQQSLNDLSITAKIKGALVREEILDKNLPSWPVSVETTNGEVYLSGYVASARQRESIMNIVKSVQGIHKINDKMTMNPK